MEHPALDEPAACTTPPIVTADTDLGWGIGAVFRCYLRAATAVLAELPGGPRGYQVLARAATGPPGTQLALAHHLGLDRTVMTYLIDDLASAGLVERRPDPADRRARQIFATPTGRTRLADVSERLAQAEDHVLAVLNTDERATFRQLVQRLAANAETTTFGNTCR